MPILCGKPISVIRAIVYYNFDLLVRGNSPSANLKNVQALLDHYRENRLLDALNRYTSQNVGSNKKQSRQKWNFDFHNDSPNFCLLAQPLRQRMCQPATKS